MATDFIPNAPGTVAATKGSGAVVGTGTAFSQYGPYDSLILDDGSHLIASITDDTHLTLHALQPYNGTTGAGKAYDWVPIPDLTRASSLNGAVYNMAKNGVLPALAAAGSAANKVPAYDGAAHAVLLSYGSAGTALLAAGTNIAAKDAIAGIATTIVASATLNLDAATDKYVPVSGNTGISVVTLDDGKERTTVFSGTPLITVGAKLILNNGGANYQVAAGDIIEWTGEAGGVVRGIVFPGSGKASQSVPTAGGTMTGALGILVAPWSGEALSAGTSNDHVGMSVAGYASALNLGGATSGFQITYDRSTGKTDFNRLSSGAYQSYLNIVSNNTVLNMPLGQLGFPSAQNSSGGANVLDDYEEGTFTPTLSFGGASVGIVYSSASGNYAKIGLLSEQQGVIILNSKGTSTGTATSGGAPFSTVGTASVTVGHYGSLSGIAAIQAYANNSSGLVFDNGSASGASSLSDANFTNNASVFWTAHIQSAS